MRERKYVDWLNRMISTDMAWGYNHINDLNPYLFSVNILTFSTYSDCSSLLYGLLVYTTIFEVNS